MRTICQFAALLTFAAATQANAAFASAKFDPDNVLPGYPTGLQMQGITRGTVVMAVSIGADGRVTDSLVLGYTQESLAHGCRTAVKDWRFTPARLDGVPVPTQVTFTVSFKLEGAVISSNIVNHFLFDNFENLGDGRFVYQISSGTKLDRAPVRLNAQTPKYAQAAEKEGVRGKVQVHFYIDENGAVRMPSVEGSGAHPYLSEIAVAAVREWKFEPPTRYGRPVLIAAIQEFNFGGTN